MKLKTWTRRSFACLILGVVPVAAEARLRGGIATGGGGGGGTTTLTPWTVTELGGGTQSSIPVEIWVPFSPAIDPNSGSPGLHPFAATDAIQILDANGVTVLACQEDNRSSDLTPELRGVLVTAILPSITSLQARQLTVQKVASTSPATGTDVTTAQVIAAAASDCIATMVHKNGTTYTASMNTALAAGAWSAKTAAANQGKWRTGGGLVTEWIVACPFKNGATAAPNNMMFWLSVSAYKAQRSAVSGPNPIIGIKIKYWIEGAWAQSTSGYGNDAYDLTVTAGSNTQSWVGSSPAKTLTLGANGGNGTKTIATVPAGGTTFTQNSVGMCISDGTGYAVIMKYIDAQNVYIFQVEMMSGTTITSGNWRIYGISHGYLQALPQQEIWYGGLAISARPIDSTLGVAWSGTAGGPLPYLVACGAVLPYSTPVAQITNDMTFLNACGTNPMSWTFSGTVNVNDIQFAGDIKMDMAAPGGREDIAPVPGWYVGGLIKNDTNGKRAIFENGLKCAQIPIQWRDQNTGKPLLLNNGVDYVTDKAWGVVLPQFDAYQSSGICQQMTPWGPQIAHHPDPHYVPWLLSGDFFWVDKRQQQIFWTWASCPPGYYGSGLNRLSCNSSELRGCAWDIRDLSLGILMVPDRSPSPLGYTRSHLTTWFNNQYSGVNSGVAGVSPFPGINIGNVNNTGVGKVYAVSGFRDMGQAIPPTGAVASFFPVGYMAFQYFMLKAAGVLTPDASAFMTWLMEGVTGEAVNASVKANWLVPAYRFLLTDQQNTGAYQNDWPNIYRNTSINPTQAGNARRNVTGTGITLSALRGSGITVTMPAGYFTAGQSFYIGGPVIDLNAASFGAIVPFGATITSITWSGGTAHATTSAAHRLPGQTTLGNITIAGASPAGYNGNYQPRQTGPNTFDYDIPDPGSPTATGSPTYSQGTPGTGYAIGNTITLTIPNPGGQMTVTRRAQLTVSAINGSGGVTGYTIADQGVYTANSANDLGDWGQNGATQFSTSGSGTGFTMTNLQYWIGWGCGIITAVSGNQLTLSTTGVFTGDLSSPIYCNGFAQTGLVSNKIQVPAPAVGDSDGSTALGLGTSVPVPYTSYAEYFDISLQCNAMAAAQGFANGVAAFASVTACYTGPSERKWKVN